MDADLLLKQYHPAPSIARRSCYYRQWTQVPGEKANERDPRKLTLSHFTFGGELGQGNYSQVMFAKYNSTQVT